MRRRHVLVVGFGLGAIAALALVGLAGGVLQLPAPRSASATLAPPSPSAERSPTISPSPPIGAGPGARAGPALIYDPENHGVLLFGGAASHPAPDGSNPAITLGDTWLWNGKAWRQLDVQGPPARSAAMVTYDPVRHVVVMFGGSGPEGAGLGLYFQDTWTWDGAHWLRQYPTHMPSPRMRSGMAFDERNSLTVMFGGEGEDAATYTDTWTWDGVDWTLLDPMVKPTTRHFFGMAYDSARGLTVLFGGSFGAARLNDTWTWNGTSWLQQPVAAPKARGWTQLAYDAATKDVVGYVYDTSAGEPAEHTIAWDGTKWADRTDAQDPSPRAEVRVTYDPDTAQVVLYGPTAETWTWNGTAWSVWEPV